MPELKRRQRDARADLALHGEFIPFAGGDGLRWLFEPWVVQVAADDADARTQGQSVEGLSHVPK